MQLVYPLNQESAILTLRINQLKDSKKFEREFSQKINAAKLMCENPKTRKEGYANLLDYYEISYQNSEINSVPTTILTPIIPISDSFNTIVEAPKIKFEREYSLIFPVPLARALLNPIRTFDIINNKTFDIIFIF